MSDVVDVNPLPPGWDSKYDFVTGKRYFINYFTRNTSLEDPRLRQRQFTETIPMQDLSNIGIAVERPMMGLNAMHHHTISNNQNHFESQMKTTSMEQSVAKISAMFPTVGETHIKTLLLKYHNREAVVMSALQVEKHPLTMPGPYTPPLGARNLPGVGVFALTPPLTPRKGGSPLPPRPGFIGSPFRNASPRPHSSPKMKLRYLKSVFPIVEETLLLDTLCNSDNNVHQATETLVNMGFDKRATPPPRVSLQKRDVSVPPVQSHPPMPPRMKSVEEKEQMKIRLQEVHPDIEERVVSIALDSVDYNEDKADQILNLMKDEKPKIREITSRNTTASSSHVVGVDCSNTRKMCPPPSPISPVFALPVVTSNHRRQKGKQDLPKVAPEIKECKTKELKSLLLMKPIGPNKELHQGPNDDLLLSDYVTWTGSNRSLAKGPDKSNLGRNMIAWGPDPKLRKGPMRGLAKGSIYSRLSKLTLNETRGK